MSATAKISRHCTAPPPPKCEYTGQWTVEARIFPGGRLILPPVRQTRAGDIPGMRCMNNGCMIWTDIVEDETAADELASQWQSQFGDYTC